MASYGASVMTTGSVAITRGARLSARAIVAAIFVIALLPLYSTPLLPFIDLYNHVARYFVLANIGDDLLLQANYAANWAILPNIGLDVIGTVLLKIVPAAVAPHLIVTGLFAAQYFGVLYFSRALTGRLSPFVALLLVPLLYSWILNWGFANFLLGLGMAFAAAGWWLENRLRPRRAVPVALVLAVAIFFTHGVAFALYGLLLGALEIGFFLEHRRPSLLLRQLGLLAAQAVLPVVLLTLSPTSGVAGGLTNADESVDRLNTAGALGARLWALAEYRLLTIVRVAEGPSLAFDAAMFVATLALLAVLFRRGTLRIAAPAWPALALGVVLVIVMPPALMGVGYVADRMPLFLALLLVASFQVKADEARDAAVVLATLVALRLIAIGVSWQAYAVDYREFRKVAGLIPRGSMVYDVLVGGLQRGSDAPRCPMYRPLLVSLDRQVAPLFANKTQQPLRLTGPLDAALNALPRGPASGDPRPGSYDRLIAAAAPAGFDYLLLCNASALTRPLPDSVQLIAQTSRLTLLKMRRTLPGIVAVTH